MFVSDGGAPRVLVVDDDADARELVAYFLGARGCAVCMADSAEQGMRELYRFAPDVIVSDIGMPGEDGYEFVRRIRALPSPHLRRLPTIAVTAFGRPEDKAMALSCGFDAHLTKPVALPNLIATIASLATSGSTVR